MGTICETARLRIRPWRLDDADLAYRMHSDPEVTRYIGGGRVVPSLEAMRHRLSLWQGLAHPDRPWLGFWAVDHKATGELIGGALLTPLEDGSGHELGYRLARAHWRHGYGTEIAIAMRDLAFGPAGLPRVDAVVYPDNAGSQAILQKIGMRLIGSYTYHVMGMQFETLRYRLDRA